METKKDEIDSLRCDKDCLTLCGIIIGFIALMGVLAGLTFVYILKPEGKYAFIHFPF